MIGSSNTSRRFPLIRKFVKLNAGILIFGTAFTCYHYPELRQEPLQLLSAMLRGTRCITTGAMMAKDYLSAKEITSETHSTAADRMFKLFCANGGPYIKLGQMFG